MRGGGDDPEPTPTPAPDEPSPPIDLVLVVDDSQSMARIQEELQGALPAALATQLDSVGAVRVGVTTTDLDASGNGAQGNLRNPGPVGAGPCDASWTQADDPEFASDLSQLIDVGTSGSGTERPLHAAALALCKASDDVFWEGLSDRPTDDPVRLVCEAVTEDQRSCNAGFLRADAAIAIVVVTDEGDATAASDFLPPPLDLDSCVDEHASDPSFGSCDCRVAWWSSFFGSFGAQVSAVGPTYQLAGEPVEICDGTDQDFGGPCNPFNSSVCDMQLLQDTSCLTGGVFEPVEARVDGVCAGAEFDAVVTAIVGALNSL